jgi:hypothetical protein
MHPLSDHPYPPSSSRRLRHLATATVIAAGAIAALALALRSLPMHAGLSTEPVPVPIVAPALPPASLPARSL